MSSKKGSANYGDTTNCGDTILNYLEILGTPYLIVWPFRSRLSALQGSFQGGFKLFNESTITERPAGSLMPADMLHLFFFATGGKKKHPIPYYLKEWRNFDKFIIHTQQVRPCAAPSP